jgi:hypothetical protein
VTDPLSRFQIVVMRWLAQRGAGHGPISLEAKYREPTLSLARRGIIEIWYRQQPGEHPSLRGPYYRLTIVGAQIAQKFLERKHPAPRGFSGAEQLT